MAHLKHGRPPAPSREEWTLVAFTNSKISPMRDLIVCAAPGSTVLRGRLLDRFAQWWDRRALAVDLITLDKTSATLEVRANGVLITSASAAALQRSRWAVDCPRCDRSRQDTFGLVDAHGMTAMVACRRCGWTFTGAAEYDLGQTA